MPLQEEEEEVTFTKMNEAEEILFSSRECSFSRISHERFAEEGERFFFKNCSTSSTVLIKLQGKKELSQQAASEKQFVKIVNNFSKKSRREGKGVGLPRRYAHASAPQN